MPLPNAPKLPMTLVAVALRINRTTTRRMPRDWSVFKSVRQITVVAVPQVSRYALEAMSSGSQRRLRMFVDAAETDPTVWMITLTDLVCNERPFLCASIALQLVWRPYAIVGRCVHTGSRVEVLAFPTQDTSAPRLVQTLQLSSRPTSTAMLVSASIDLCLTPECESAVWGSERMCPACTMRFPVLSS